MASTGAVMEWRKMGDHEWWLVYKEAPADLGRNGPVGYPPEMSMEWVGGEWACCHLYSYSNGAWPDDPNLSDEDVDYVHVCDPIELVAQLQDWMKMAEYFNVDNKQRPRGPGD